MIKIVDKAGILSGAEVARLQRFVAERCFSRVKDRSWVKHILIRRDGPTDYLGYWTAQSVREGAWLRRFESVIVLNATYLLTVDAMEEVLAHEYGHNWTLGYLMMWEIVERPRKQRAPWLYYRIRRLDPDDFVCDYSNGWNYCDKEVLAEDYRFLLTTYRENYAMENLVGLPSSEVRTYLERLGRPIWER